MEGEKRTSRSRERSPAAYDAVGGGTTLNNAPRWAPLSRSGGAARNVAAVAPNVARSGDVRRSPRRRSAISRALLHASGQVARPSRCDETESVGLAHVRDPGA